MSVGSCLRLLVAGLASTRLVAALPLNGSNFYAVEEASLASGLTLRYPDFLLEKRHDEEEQHGYGESGYGDDGYADDGELDNGEPDNGEVGTPEPPPCDRICVQRLLYQTAYSSVSTGMEYAMAVHKVPEYCFGEAKDWCPQIVDTQTTMIASRASYLNLDLDWCDDACLMVAMGEVAKQGALQGMKWIDEAFGSESGADPAEVDKLRWSMWYLITGASTSVDAAEANHKEPPKPAPSRSWNSTSPGNSTANGQNSTAPGNDSTSAGLNSSVTANISTSNATNSTVLSGSYHGTNLLLPYLTGGACVDDYLCHDNNKGYISGLLQKAAADVNGTTWLGFILVGAAGSSADGPSKDIHKQNFPSWVKEPHCGGGGGHCPTPPDVGPQRPPPDFTPQNIAPPPPNPYAPEQASNTKQRLPSIEEQPEPEDEEDTRHREQKQKEDEEYIKKKCENNRQCELEEMKKANEAAKNREEQKKQDKVDQAESEDVQKAKDREEADKKERQEVCKTAPDVPKCELEQEKKQEEIRKKEDIEEAKQEVADRTHANDPQNAAKELCQKDEECLNRERQRIAKEAEEEQQRREAERKAYEEKCARDRACELEEARKAREQREQELQKQREEEEKTRRKNECGDDSLCLEREKANQEARKKASQKDKDAEVEDLRKQISGRRHRLPAPPDPEKPSLRGTPHRYPDAPEFRPFRNGDFDTMQRFRSSRYDTTDGTMRVGDLQHAPLVKQKVWDEIGRSGQPPSAFKLGRIMLNNYEPFHVKVNGKDTGKVEWQHWEDLVRSDDGSWLYGKDKSFKMSGGGWARNALGDPVMGGKPGDPPLRTEPIPGKRVRFEEYADYKLIDKESTELLKPDGAPERVNFNPNQPLREQGNFKQFLQEGYEADFDEFTETWMPKKHYNDAKHPVNKLKDNVLNRFQWDGAGDDPDVDSPDSPNRHGAGNSKDSDSDRKTDRQTMKKLREKFNTPEGMKISADSKLRRFNPKKFFPGMNVKVPYAGAVGIAAAAGQEVFFLADAKGDAEVYWDCLKSRLVPFLVNTCGARDADGNEIEVEDKGPWGNYVENMFGWLKPEDIDGDGDLENAWEKFVASMDDTGHAIKEFFADGEDGKGFLENTGEFIINVNKTIADGIYHIWDGTKHVLHETWHGIKKVAKKVKRFFGFGDDDDD